MSSYDPHKTAGGKGSKYRPVDKQKFNENWDRIFGKKHETDQTTKTDQ